MRYKSTLRAIKRGHLKAQYNPHTGRLTMFRRTAKGKWILY